MIPDAVAAIMVSTAIYPALDSSRRPAALSSRIIGDLLRGRLGFKGVVMTDDLERPTGYSAGRATVLAAAAGADIELLSTTEAAGAAAYSALTAAARRGALSRASIAASYRRILALKLRFARF
jgi:beta-N-acetylhexosaminidase